jgi:hypothetical protein
MLAGNIALPKNHGDEFQIPTKGARLHGDVINRELVEQWNSEDHNPPPTPR